MRILIILLFLASFAFTSFAQSDTTEIIYDPIVMDSTKTHRFGIVFGGGTNQFILTEAQGIVDDSLNNWTSKSKLMYKAGFIYNRRINEAMSFQTGLVLNNAYYLINFTDKNSDRSESNAYSQIDIPFDMRFRIYKGIQVSLGLQYNIDVTKSPLKEKRLFNLKGSALSVKGALGYRFVVGEKYLQTDAFVQYGFTDILVHEDRYSNALESMHPYMFGLRLAFY